MYFYFPAYSMLRSCLGNVFGNKEPADGNSVFNFQNPRDIQIFCIFEGRSKEMEKTGFQIV